MSEMKRYVIIHQDDNLTQCYGAYVDVHRAIGKLVCWMTEVEENLLFEGYSLTKRSDFKDCEMDIGWMWSRVYELHNEHCNTVINDTWYLLTSEVTT